MRRPRPPGLCRNALYSILLCDKKTTYSYCLRGLSTSQRVSRMHNTHLDRARSTATSSTPGTNRRGTQSRRIPAQSRTRTVVPASRAAGTRCAWHVCPGTDEDKGWPDGGAASTVPHLRRPGPLPSLRPALPIRIALAVRVVLSLASRPPTSAICPFSASCCSASIVAVMSSMAEVSDGCAFEMAHELTYRDQAQHRGDAEPARDGPGSC